MTMGSRWITFALVGAILCVAATFAFADGRYWLGLALGLGFMVLDTVDGKCQTIGFYDTVLGRPAAAFERLEATLALTTSDLLRAARRYLRPEQRSVVLVHPPVAEAGEAA